MSGFQIPGLGQAKPNEVLPPLPQGSNEPAAAPALAPADEAMKDAGDAPAKSETEQSNTAALQTLNSDADGDAMVIDRPASPPSLTDAFEAALAGLDKQSTPAAQPAQATPAAQQNEPVVSDTPTGQNIPQASNGQVPLQSDAGNNPEWEVDSSPYESSSESSSDSSDDDDSDNEGYELLGVEETARLLMEAEGGSDDEGERGGKGLGTGQVRTRNEVPDEVIPRPDVTITPEMEIVKLGTVKHVVDTIALVQGVTDGEYRVLDNGSVLCNADRVVIGVVAEIIGKVTEPMYTVHFNSPEEIKELGIQVDMEIYYPIAHATYVFTEPLKNLKGSDASNLHDEEVGADEMEFSDDEKEAEYKRSQKQKKKDKFNKGKGAREGQGPHPLRQETRADGGLNYDDGAEDDGPYKPLARPAGYGEGSGSTETYDPVPRSGQHGRRGDRGRGRGRGGAGRGGRGGQGSSRDGYSLPPQGAQPYAAQQPGAPQGFPNFNFQVPGWPQQGQPGQPPAFVPPPPPNWSAQGQQAPQGQGQPQGNANGMYMNPALVAAFLSQMQQHQQGNQNQSGQ